MAIEIEDAPFFENFPPFNASDLPQCDFSDATNFSDFNLDNIDVDFSVEDIDLYLNDSPLDSSDSNSNAIPHSPNSILTSNSPSSNLNTLSPISNTNSNPKSTESNSSFNNKRKIEDVDDIQIENPNRNLNEEVKRKVRLMRNRESAHMSRQRKKQYIEELEQKVKVLNATVADLNGKVSYYMAENVRLNSLVNGNSGGSGSNSAIHSPPLPPPMPHPYVWFPYYGYPMKPNYVPIPRLKSAKKEESKKTERKRKKLASVSFLGLFLLAMLVIGGVMNFGLGESRGGGDGGKVFDVKGHDSSFKNDSNNNKVEFGNMSRMYSEVMSGLGDKYSSSESLPALLYVPRNGKHVEINGNLIIQSVLASERAVANESSGSNGREKSLAIAKPRGSPFAVSNSKDPRACGKINEHPKALPSDSHGAYWDNTKSPLADKSLQQWFLEGLAGPIPSFGTCTEVFRFDTSPSAVNPGGLIPAAPALNITDKIPSDIRSRRMGRQLIPLNGTTYNNKTQQFEKPTTGNNSLNGNSSSMVVSVLVDPRETGDVDCDGMITPKSISRIFVVVLVDSVKYITYSCMLPFKSHVPHLGD